MHYELFNCIARRTRQVRPANQCFAKRQLSNIHLHWIWDQVSVARGRRGVRRNAGAIDLYASEKMEGTQES